MVDRIVAAFEQKHADGEPVAGRKIVDVNTVNGVRFTLDGGAWGLVRASSNTPNLVVVVESPESHDDVKSVFQSIKTELAKYPEIGAFDQEI